MHTPSHVGVHVFGEREKYIFNLGNSDIFFADIMLWFEEVVLFCFLMEINKRRTSCVALFWHCQAFGLVLRAACSVFCRQHRVIHMSHSLPKYYPSWILVGLGFLFILGCSLTKQNIFSFFAFCISASTFYRLPSFNWKGRFSQSLFVWLVCQCHGKAKTLGLKKCQHPVLWTLHWAVPWIREITHNQSITEPPAPGLLSWVCYSLQAAVGAFEGLTPNLLWNNIINVMENCDSLRIAGGSICLKKNSPTILTSFNS